MAISTMPQTNGGPTLADHFHKDNDNSALPNPIHPDFLPRLDEDFVQYYNKHFASKPATHTIDIAEIRSNPTKYSSPWEKDYLAESYVQDIQLVAPNGHRFRVRCYHPDATKFGTGPYPIHVNFHGMMCDLVMVVYLLRRYIILTVFTFDRRRIRIWRTQG